MSRSRLGIDLGTSSIKTVLVSEDARILASGKADYTTVSDLPGQAEQDPSAWISAVSQAVEQIGITIGPRWPEDIESIGLTGQLPTLVCLGVDGVIGRAITWRDSRADAWILDRLDDKSRAAIYKATGMPVDGRYLGPLFRYHWWPRREKIRCIMSAKDFLAFVLTGRAVTDPSTAAGYATYGLSKGTWLPELCAIWDLDPSWLPEIADAPDCCGPLNANGARILGLPEGVLVRVGAADSVAGAYAMTGLRTDLASVVMGSSTTVVAATHECVLDTDARYLLTPHVVPNWYGREMDLLSSGTGFGWIGDLLGVRPAALETLALESQPGASGTMFAPYLAGGEQGALWDSNLCGVIHGLSTDTTSSDLARAYLEGVFYEIRRCLSVLSEVTPISGIVLSGRAATNDGLVRLLADVIGRSVRVFRHESPSAVGAAIIGVDELTKSIGDSDLVGPGVEPGNDAKIYDDLYQRHLDLFPRIARLPK